MQIIPKCFAFQSFGFERIQCRLFSINVLPFNLLALSVPNVDYSVNVLPFNLLVLRVSNVDYSV
jgi:hypothetical protein